jgi:hypothetical protein
MLVKKLLVKTRSVLLIAVYSKSLNAAQRNYPATKREGLGLVFGLLKGKCYLWGRESLWFVLTIKPLHIC